MISTLLSARIEFTADLAELIRFIRDKGYFCVVGKDGEKHMTGSLHYDGLAHDVLIYDLDGNWLTDTEAYRFAGIFWKSLRTVNKWGGDFKKADGNHFSHAFSGKA